MHNKCSFQISKQLSLDRNAYDMRRSESHALKTYQILLWHNIPYNLGLKNYIGLNVIWK